MKYLISTILLVSGIYIGLSVPSEPQTFGATISTDLTAITLEKDQAIADKIVAEELAEKRKDIYAKVCKDNVHEVILSMDAAIIKTYSRDGIEYVPITQCNK